MECKSWCAFQFVHAHWQAALSVCARVKLKHSSFPLYAMFPPKVVLGAVRGERKIRRYDHLVDAADCPAHRIARAHALACLAWLDNALSDIQSALAGEPEVFVMQALSYAHALACVLAWLRSTAVAGEPENGVYLQLRGIVQERMGDFYEAAMDFTAALPLLKASGCALSECIFNRGYCHRNNVRLPLSLPLSMNANSE
eukprot:1160859-Pelagomonas_calceolata.AAC.14